MRQKGDGSNLQADLECMQKSVCVPEGWQPLTCRQALKSSASASVSGRCWCSVMAGSSASYRSRGRLLPCIQCISDEVQDVSETGAGLQTCPRETMHATATQGQAKPAALQEPCYGSQHMIGKGADEEC